MFLKDGMLMPGEEVETASFTVVTLGFEERTRNVLNHSLRRKSVGVCQLGEAQQAQVALLDLDNSGARYLLSEFQQNYPDKAVIGIGRQQTDLPVQAFVTIPLNQEQLLDTIFKLANMEISRTKNMITDDKVARAMQALENKKIASSINKRAEQNQPRTAAKRAMPGKTDEMCFNPERFLLGTVIGAVTRCSAGKETAVLRCWSDRVIVIDPGQGKVSTDLNDNQIRTLAIAPIDDNLSSPIHVNFYPSDEVNNELDTAFRTNGLRHFPQETFLWDLGLLTCRGRIPVEFTVCNRHYLRRWPNLTRINVPANAMRILSYWSQQPCSLMDIKEQLDIPLQDVFSVFSAAYAAGLTGEAKRCSDQIMESVDLNDHKRRGLMTSIINRLRGNKSEQISRTA
ncbi:MAG: hypothetical protein P8019_09030 [Gammaproteobacteria bacterium]|jgi:hypothetical protein